LYFTEAFAMMKRNAYLLLAGFLVLSLGLTGCDTLNLGNDDLSDLNDNPNASTEPDVDALLANGQRDIAFEWFGDDETMRGGNLLAQYTTQNQYAENSVFIEEPRVSDFADFYNPLNDLETVKDLVREKEETIPLDENTIAVALIHQVWTFQLVTDIYGSVPFEEALQGPSNPSPAYTPQQEIYPALIDSLNTALSKIQTSAPGPSGDLIYGGDMTKWQRFANALKMRIGMRMSDANTSVARSAVESAAGNAFQSNADNAYFEFSTSSQHRSTIFENRFVAGRNDFDVADRFVNFLTDTYSVVDPRTPTYVDEARANPDKTYNGFPTHLGPSDAAGLKAQRQNDFFSKPGDYFLEPDVAAPMLLYDEVRFVLAEAANKGWNVPGTAEEHFEAAVRASINNWNPDAPQSQVDSYVSDVMSDLSSSSFSQVLGEQKWVALYFQGIQGWSEWRRLDFEGHIREPEGGWQGDAGGLTLWAMRIDYPDNEFSVNPDNVETAAEQQFGSVEADHYGSRLWWDVDQPPAEVRP
jgi:hypothetical protein